MMRRVLHLLRQTVYLTAAILTLALMAWGVHVRMAVDAGFAPDGYLPSASSLNR